MSTLAFPILVALYLWRPTRMLNFIRPIEHWVPSILFSFSFFFKLHVCCSFVYAWLWLNVVQDHRKLINNLKLIQDYLCSFESQVIFSLLFNGVEFDPGQISSRVTMFKLPYNPNMVFSPLKAWIVLLVFYMKTSFCNKSCLHKESRIMLFLILNYHLI